MSTTYLTLTNNTITESGADLASFSTNGSDFATGGNSLMNKIKGWVSRAWKDIQQEAYDWEFMSQQAVVNIDPGFMFYTAAPASIKSVAAAMPNGTLFNVYDQNGQVAVPNLKVNYIQDLTGVSTQTSSAALTAAFNPFGALTLQIDGNTSPPLNVAFKSGSEYFTTNVTTSVTLAVTWPFGGHPSSKAGIASLSATFFTLFADNSSTIITYDILANSPNYTIDINTGNITLPINSTLSDILFSGGIVSLASVACVVNWQYAYNIQLSGSPTYTQFVLGSYTPGNQLSATDIEVASGSTVDGLDSSNALSQVFTIQGGTLSITSIDLLRNASYKIASVSQIPGPPGNPTLYDFTVNSGTGSSAVPFPNTGETVTLAYAASLTGLSGSLTYTTANANCYIHSWKSFDFINGEHQSGDFVQNVQEIDEKSFRLTDFYGGNPLSEVPLTFVPWEVFRSQYDLTGAYPGIPRIVTEDNTGRWRFYPPPYYRVTVKFDYVRKPQLLSLWNDTIVGLDDDFIDVIMWKALIYYGEYDEQPSMVARATKNYKTLLSRLELRNREKFHFQPHRMW